MGVVVPDEEMGVETLPLNPPKPQFLQLQCFLELWGSLQLCGDHCSLSHMLHLPPSGNSPELEETQGWKEGPPCPGALSAGLAYAVGASRKLQRDSGQRRAGLGSPSLPS